MRKPIFAIDPGNKHSAYCVYFPDTHTLGDFGKVTNQEMREIIKNSKQWEYDYAIEMIQSYSMAVGTPVFNTCLWVGRFIELIKPRDVTLIYRPEVKSFCGLKPNKSWNDSNVRRVIIRLFPQTGGGKEPAIGIKRYPGPLYGVSNDVWAALGVALTFNQKLQQAAA